MIDIASIVKVSITQYGSVTGTRYHWNKYGDIQSVDDRDAQQLLTVRVPVPACGGQRVVRAFTVIGTNLTETKKSVKMVKQDIPRKQMLLEPVTTAQSDSERKAEPRITKSYTRRKKKKAADKSADGGDE